MALVAGCTVGCGEDAATPVSPTASGTSSQLTTLVETTAAPEIPPVLQVIDVPVEKYTPAVPPVLFSFQGVVGKDCFVCGAGSKGFGRGVPPGTPVSGIFMFDSNTRPTPSFQPNRVDYFGVSVEFTVGTETIRGNNPARAKIQIYNGPPSGDSYSLIAEGGFSSGTIAGVRIDEFIWVV